MDTRNHGTTRGRKPSASRKSAGRNMRSKEYDYDPYEEDYGRTGRNSSSSYRRDGDYDDYEDEVDDRYEDRRRSRRRAAPSKRRSSRRKRRTRSLILLAVELVVAVVLVFVLRGFLTATKVGKVKLNEAEIKGNMNEGVVTNSELDGYRNIALFGVDSTKGALNKATRSDSIIIASIKEDSGDVKLCSVYRDTYLDIGDGIYGKCNGAYAKGGPTQAINMLNRSLDLNITDFITIGFGGLTKAIDSLGGITLNIPQNMITALNNYQISMVGKTDDGIHYTAQSGKDYKPITQAGEQLVNGLQATAYCRVRYIEGNDFARAQHQREVIMKTLEKAKSANPAKLEAIANDVFGQTYTSLDIKEILQILSHIGNYQIVDQTGFPNQEQLKVGNIGKAGSCVVPTDLASNVSWVHQFLFGTENYQVSEEIRKVSEQITGRTAKYLR